MHALTACRTKEMFMVTDQCANIMIEDAQRDERVLPMAHVDECGTGTVFVDESLDVWVLEPLEPGEGDKVLLFDQDKVH